MDYRLKTGHFKQKLSDGGDEIDWAGDETTKNNILESNESFFSNWQHIK